VSFTAQAISALNVVQSYQLSAISFESAKAEPAFLTAGVQGRDPPLQGLLDRCYVPCPTQLGRTCEALECGSLLPLSTPRICSPGFQPREQFPASKLARAKAAASCRTPKPRMTTSTGFPAGCEAPPFQQPPESVQTWLEIRANAFRLLLSCVAPDSTPAGSRAVVRGVVRGRRAQKSCPCPRLLNFNPFGVAFCFLPRPCGVSHLLEGNLQIANNVVPVLEAKGNPDAFGMHAESAFLVVGQR